MTFAACRTLIKSAVDALVPTTTLHHADKFRHVEQEQDEDMSVDRQYMIMLTAQKYKSAVIPSCTTPVYESTFDVVVWYAATDSLADDEDIVEQDASAIRVAIQGLVGTSPIASYSDLPSWDISHDDVGNITMRQRWSLLHL